jgi:hypothetical protein
MKASNTHRLRIVVINISIFILLLFLLEVALRLTGKYRTYSEKAVGIYWSVYNDIHTNWYNRHDSGAYINFHLPEFVMQFYANNEGVRDTTFHKAKTRFRIITAGDSFCEGLGTTNDSTWQKQLYNMLPDTLKSKVEIWNAGLISSDPIAEYAFLRDRLIQYKPDLFTMQINATDIGDVKVRGGFERFQPNDSVVFRKPPVSDWFYSHSHVFRALSNLRIQNTEFLDESLIPFWRQEEERAKATGLVNIAIDSAYHCCKLNGCRFLVILQPQEYEFTNGTQLRNIQNHCVQYKIPCIDAMTEMKALGIDNINFAALYWPIDTHFNNNGAYYFAKALLETFIDYIHAGNNDHSYAGR